MKKRIFYFIIAAALIAGSLGFYPASTGLANGIPTTRGSRVLAAWDGISVGGYTSRPSVAQGESIGFYISTDLPTYNLKIYREGGTRTLMTTIPNLTGVKYECLGGYAIGCGWPVAVNFQVPASWPSGFYTVEIPTTAKGNQFAIFWVREDSPGSASTVLYLASVNGYQATSNFGGKSFFDLSSDSNLRSSVLSFDRPYGSNGRGNWPLEQDLVVWAEAKGYTLEYATTYDMEYTTGLLDPYQVVVLGGYGDYWSWSMRQQVKAFLGRGGRLINLSGKTMWFQTRYENNGRTVISYQNAASDPISTTQSITSRASDFPILDTEAAITGLSFRSGGLTGASFITSTLSYENGYGGYWVQNSSHWVFEGTDLTNGSVLGRGTDLETSVLGRETDGTTFNCDVDGRTILGAIGNNGTPENFRVLGIAPASQGANSDMGFAAFGIYTLPGGGAVFSSGSVGWSSAIHDPKVAQITANVLNRFIANDIPAEPANPADSEYLFVDRFNCKNLDHEGAAVTDTGPAWFQGVPSHNYSGWVGDLSLIRYNDICGVRGGSGLEFTAIQSTTIELHSQLNPNWQGVNKVYTSMWVNFAGLALPDGGQFTLLKSFAYNGISDTAVMTLRVRMRAGQLSVRVSDNATNISGAWIDVPKDRPFLLETGWDQANNLISLWVDSKRLDLTVPLTTLPAVNRVDFGVKNLPIGTTGSICVDEMGIAEQRIGFGFDANTPIYLPVISR